jgi:hypothetical protein
MLANGLLNHVAGNLHEVAFFAGAFRHDTIMAHMAGARYYLVYDDKTLGIWGPITPQAFLDLNKEKPQFKLINSYPTRTEARAEKQKRLISN